MAKPKLALIPSAQGSKFYSVLPSSGVGDFDFTRSGSATRINSQGLIETVGGGVSRLNYPMIDGVVKGCPSHLLEPERLQKIQYSEDFSQLYWSKLGASVVSNSTISPDGTLNASKLIEGTNNGTHILYRNNIVTGAGINTLSVKVKANGRNWVLLYDAEQSEAVYFDLENGVSGSTIGSPDDYSITALPNGWYDISLTTTATSKVDFQIYTAENDEVFIYQGDGVSGIYVWGAQLEQGSYPTSYIPNYGTSAGITRSAETANGSGDASTFNDSEGVLMAEISGLTEVGTNQSIAISNGTQSNRILFRYNSTNQVRVIVVSSNAFVFDKTLNISSIEEYNKFSIKYKQDDFALWVNGFELKSDNSGVTPTGLNELALDDGSGVNDFYGNTKQVQYFDSALNDNELEQLTSWVSFSDMAEGQLYTIE